MTEFNPTLGRAAVRRRALLAACLLTVIVALSVAPAADRPHTGAPGQLEHLVAYAGVAFLLTFGDPARRRMAWFATLVALSGALEIAQLFIPGRHAQVIDWLASSAGAGLGALAAATAGTMLARKTRSRAAE